MFLNLFLFYQVVRPLGHKSVNKYLYLYLYLYRLLMMDKYYMYPNLFIVIHNISDRKVSR